MLKRILALIGVTLFVLFTTAPAALAETQFIGYDVPTANSLVMGITSGPDGNIWFTEYNGDANKVSKITPGGNITEYPFPTIGNPGSIVVGADGNLWVSGGGGQNKLYRVTTEGNIQGFDITPPSDAAALAVDNSGNIWFTRRDSQIGMRSATDGTFSAFPVTTPGDLGDITLGPDGNMWFMEEDANKVGVITPGGDVNEYDIPTANSLPQAITAGPDGNLWFTTANNGTKISRITTAGVITEHSPPASWLNVLNDIVTGPDGNLWMTAGGQIVRFKLDDGTFTMYDVPWENSMPFNLTFGPYGNIWFTDQNANKIGVFLLAGLPSPSPNPDPSSTTVSGVPGAPDSGFGVASQNILSTLIPYGIAVILLFGLALGANRFARKQ